MQVEVWLVIPEATGWCVRGRNAGRRLNGRGGNQRFAFILGMFLSLLVPNTTSDEGS